MAPPIPFGPPWLYGGFLSALEHACLSTWPGCRGMAGTYAGQATTAMGVLTGENWWINPLVSLPLGWDNTPHSPLEGEVHGQSPAYPR